MRDPKEWFDITYLGSEYEIQMSRGGTYRHRPLEMPPPEHDGIFQRMFREEGGWIPGEPPKKA